MRSQFTWSPSRRILVTLATYLLLLNAETQPQQASNFSQIVAEVESLSRKERDTYRFQWYAGKYPRMVPGDVLILIQVGAPRVIGEARRGVVAIGRACSEVYLDTHFIDELAANGDQANYVDFQPMYVREKPFITIQELTARFPERKKWAPQNSGQSLPDQLGDRVLEMIKSRYSSKGLEGWPLPGRIARTSEQSVTRRQRDYIDQEIQDVYVLTASIDDDTLNEWLSYESRWTKIASSPERSANFELTWSVSSLTHMNNGDYFVMLKRDGSQAGIIGYGWCHEIEQADGEALVDLRPWTVVKDALVSLKDLQTFFPGIAWTTHGATTPLPQLVAEELILELDRRTFGKSPEPSTSLTAEEHEVIVESVEIIAKARKGQDRFRTLLIERAVHDGLTPQCEVCGFDDLNLLDAAHIEGYAEGGKSSWDNGALLCATHHRAMDRGYFVLTGDWPNRKPEYSQQGYEFITHRTT